MKEKWTKLGKSLICLALDYLHAGSCGGGGNSSSSSEKQTSGGTSGEVQQGTITSMRRLAYCQRTRGVNFPLRQRRQYDGF